MVNIDTLVTIKPHQAKLNLITYCYWGEGFNDLVIEINNEKFPVQYTEENDVKRNQLFVYIDIAVNEEYLPISFGKQISRKIIDLDKKAHH